MSRSEIARLGIELVRDGAAAQVAEKLAASALGTASKDLAAGNTADKILPKLEQVSGSRLKELGDFDRVMKLSDNGPGMSLEEFYARHDALKLGDIPVRVRRLYVSGGPGYPEGMEKRELSAVGRLQQPIAGYRGDVWNVKHTDGRMAPYVVGTELEPEHIINAIPKDVRLRAREFDFPIRNLSVGDELQTGYPWPKAKLASSDVETTNRMTPPLGRARISEFYGRTNGETELYGRYAVENVTPESALLRHTSDMQGRTGSGRLYRVEVDQLREPLFDRLRAIDPRPGDTLAIPEGRTPDILDFRYSIMRGRTWTVEETAANGAVVRNGDTVYALPKEYLKEPYIFQLNDWLRKIKET